MRKESQYVREMLGHGADAFMVGAGAAAIVALIRQMAEANRQKKLKAKRESNEIDPNTVVLTIGQNRKVAEDTECKATDCTTSAACPKIEAGVVSREIRPSVVQPRMPNGQYTSIDSSMSDNESEKDASVLGLLDGPVTVAGNILAVLGGSAAGYVVVNKIAQRLEQKRLQKQVDAAQKEYIALLGGNRKVAEAFSDLFMFDDDSVEELEKSAGVLTDLYHLPGGVTGTAKNGLGAMLAAYILAAGGSAYVVKRLLEDRFSKKEEEPEQKTRILLKTSSSEFEISPDHFLATIGIMRDCIADSMPIKCAEDGSATGVDGINYGFLDDISKLTGGKQFILDQYAKQQGLSRPDNDLGIPMSTLSKYGPDLLKYHENPDAYRSGVNTYVMNMMKNDPEAWFQLLGQKNNQDLVRLKANEQIANLNKGSGWMATLASIPLLGPAFKKFLSWYTTNSKYGRRMVARRYLDSTGLAPDKVDAIISKYDFSSPDGWSALPVEKAASVIGDYVTWASRLRNVKDNSNREILLAIQNLKEEQEAGKGKKKKRPKKDSKLVVEFDKDLDGVIPPEYRKKLIAALEASA